ncbi:unnamed protein product [Closterium sp. NIES-53]
MGPLASEERPLDADTFVAASADLVSTPTSDDGSVTAFLSSFPLPLILRALDTGPSSQTQGMEEEGEGDRGVSEAAMQLQQAAVQALFRVFKSNVVLPVLPSLLPYAEKGMLSPSPDMRRLCCFALQRMAEGGEEEMQELGSQGEVARRVVGEGLVRCLGDEHLPVAAAATDALAAFCRSPLGVSLIFSSDHLYKLTRSSHSQVQQRAVEAALRLANQSQHAMSAVEKLDLLQPLVMELQGVAGMGESGTERGGGTGGGSTEEGGDALAALAACELVSEVQFTRHSFKSTLSSSVPCGGAFLPPSPHACQFTSSRVGVELLEPRIDEIHQALVQICTKASSPAPAAPSSSPAAAAAAAAARPAEASLQLGLNLLLPAALKCAARLTSPATPGVMAPLTLIQADEVAALFNSMCEAWGLSEEHVPAETVEGFFDALATYARWFFDALATYACCESLAAYALLPPKCFVRAPCSCTLCVLSSPVPACIISFVLKHALTPPCIRARGASQGTWCQPGHVVPARARGASQGTWCQPGHVVPARAPGASQGTWCQPVHLVPARARGASQGTWCQSTWCQGTWCQGMPRHPNLENSQTSLTWCQMSPLPSSFPHPLCTGLSICIGVHLWSRQGVSTCIFGADRVEGSEPVQMVPMHATLSSSPFLPTLRHSPSNTQASLHALASIFGADRVEGSEPVQMVPVHATHSGISGVDEGGGGGAGGGGEGMDLEVGDDGETKLKEETFAAAAKAPGGPTLAVYRLLAAVVEREWAAVELCGDWGLVQMVTDAQAERHKAAMDWRHSCCVAMSTAAEAQHASISFNCTAQLAEAVRRGPYLRPREIEPRPIVVTDERPPTGF